MIYLHLCFIPQVISACDSSKECEDEIERLSSLDLDDHLEDDTSILVSCISILVLHFVVILLSIEVYHHWPTLINVINLQSPRRKSEGSQHPSNTVIEDDDNEDEDEVFLYDDHIPSIPSLPTRYYDKDYNGVVRPPSGPMGSVHQRRNRLLKMISDPKCYNPRVLKSLSVDNKRRRSQDIGIPIPEHNKPEKDGEIHHVNGYDREGTSI